MLWPGGDAGLKTHPQLPRAAGPAQGLLGFSFPAGPGCWRAGDPRSPRIRLGPGVLVSPQGGERWFWELSGSLCLPLCLSSDFFPCKALEQAAQCSGGVAIPGSVQKTMWTLKYIISFLF